MSTFSGFFDIDEAPTGLHGVLKSLDDPLLRSLTVHASDVIMVLDLEAHIRFINRLAPGLTMDQVANTQVYAFVPEEQHAAMRECFAQVLATRKAGRYESIYTNPLIGTPTFWESRAAPIFREDEVVGFVVISSNVTERREAAAERDLLFSLSRDILCVTGFDGFFKRLNPALCRTLQYSSEELLARPYLEFVHPEDVEETFAAGKALEQGCNAMDFVNRYRRKDGQFRTLSWRATAEHGSKVILTVGRDVTEQRALEMQLRQSQKMEAVGQLAGGLAHDFNNLLLSIMVNTELGQKATAELPAVNSYFSEIARAAERSSDLVKQLLAFSRRKPSRVAAQNVNNVLRDLVLMVRRLIPESIALEFEPELDLPIVEADAGQIEQVVLNLCLNARDAMPRGGRLILKTQCVNVGSEASTTHQPKLRSGPHVAISVTDTGTGMSEPVRERIFEPFFTTKEPGKGTGLGLATAYAIVEQHHGFWEVESGLGQGSVFRIYLPISAAQEVATPRGQAARPSNQGLTILVAEDEELVQKAVTMILERAGYRVLSAGNGLEALALLEQPGQAVSLVLLDVVMPRMGGPETYRRIRERWPDMKVILSSGYTDQSRFSGDLPSEVRVLEKPYRADSLLERIRTELGFAEIEKPPASL